MCLQTFKKIHHDSQELLVHSLPLDDITKFVQEYLILIEC